MPSLTATYTSPVDSKTFTHDLPPPTSPHASTNSPSSQTPSFHPPTPSHPQTPILSPTSSLEHKNHHLSTLRTSVRALQDEINTFLTMKMEEDKRSAATLASSDNAGGERAGGVDEQRAGGVDEQAEEERMEKGEDAAEEEEDG